MAGVVTGWRAPAPGSHTIGTDKQIDITELSGSSVEPVVVSDTLKRVPQSQVHLVGHTHLLLCYLSILEQLVQEIKCFTVWVKIPAKYSRVVTTSPLIVVSRYCT